MYGTLPQYATDRSTQSCNSLICAGIGPACNQGQNASDHAQFLVYTTFIISILYLFRRGHGVVKAIGWPAQPNFVLSVIFLRKFFFRSTRWYFQQKLAHGPLGVI